MNFDRMRALLLEHAIQGKLVPQLDDEPDVEQIGKTREEVPFDIPKKWKWLPLKVVCKDFLVPMRDKPTFSNNQMDTPWCRIEDIVEGKYLRGSKSARFLSEKTIQDMNLKVNPVGTVISACSASIGAAAVVETQCCTNQTFIGLVCDEQHLFNWYLYFVLKSAKQRLVDIGTGTTIKYISRKKYEEFLIPVPSLSEQRRIVAKLEESFAEIDRAEKAYEELQSLSGVLRGRILQKAIQGKLVPQMAEEGVVEQIGTAPEEVPFEIPESWKWVQLKSIGQIIGGGTPKTSVADYWNGDISWITPADLGKNTSKWILNGAKSITQKGLDESSAKLMPEGSIIYSSRAPIGHIAIAAHELCTNQGCKSFVPDAQFITTEWAYYMLIARTRDIQSRASGTTFKEISGKGVGETWVSLPPIAEQQRIVAKVEELLKQVDTLSA